MKTEAPLCSSSYLPLLSVSMFPYSLFPILSLRISLSPCLPMYVCLVCLSPYCYRSCVCCTFYCRYERLCSMPPPRTQYSV
ncbi:hypothetical protein B484DRAFT_447261 [Ochromonadaceae sp. CCMP2298]|nr:hypothetical protein B484DRAFT_447261 [Ochromonadaceae sp. CCMP2298]